VLVDGDQCEIDAVLLEVPQDLLGAADASAGWAARLATVLSALAAGGPSRMVPAPQTAPYYLNRQERD
jgi:predicted N-formylglutamate amidohydrolase